jgi:hypothetical protein
LHDVRRGRTARGAAERPLDLRRRGDERWWIAGEDLNWAINAEVESRLFAKDPTESALYSPAHGVHAVAGCERGSDLRKCFPWHHGLRPEVTTTLWLCRPIVMTRGSGVRGRRASLSSGESTDGRHPLQPIARPHARLRVCLQPADQGTRVDSRALDRVHG